MKILLVLDPYPIVADAICKLADELLPTWLTVRAKTLAEALTLIQTAEFAGGLIDLDLPDAKGLNTLKKLQAKAPNLPIVVHSSGDAKRLKAKVLDLGAKAFVSKQETREQLRQALIEQFDETRVAAPTMSLYELTPRQLDVVRLIASGERNNGIAHSLGVSPETVKSHVKKLLALTQCSNRAELAVWATRLNQQSRFNALALPSPQAPQRLVAA